MRATWEPVNNGWPPAGRNLLSLSGRIRVVRVCREWVPGAERRSRRWLLMVRQQHTDLCPSIPVGGLAFSTQPPTQGFSHAPDYEDHEGNISRKRQNNATESQDSRMLRSTPNLRSLVVVFFSGGIGGNGRARRLQSCGGSVAAGRLVPAIAGHIPPASPAYPTLAVLRPPPPLLQTTRQVWAYVCVLRAFLQ